MRRTPSESDARGPLAQLNRVSDYGSEGCRFESCMGHNKRLSQTRGLFFLKAPFTSKNNMPQAQSNTTPSRRTIYVVAAIIRDAQGRIFATQRGYGDFKDFWEFPGGKIEPGETAEQALRREIWEELETRIIVDGPAHNVEWDYPAFHLSMQCFWCRVQSGNLLLKEHEAARWLSIDQLDSVEWLPADRDLIQKLKTTA